MAAWSHLSNSWEYRFTEGDHYVVRNSKFPNEAWRRISEFDVERNVYEEVTPSKVDKKRNHIVIHKDVDGELVLDSKVPQLMEKAKRWDSMTKLVPGFTEEMLLVADLMYKTEYHLTSQLNSSLYSKGLKKVNHIMEAIYRIENTYGNEAKKAAHKEVLNLFFQGLASEGTAPEVVMQQWATCRDWQCKRVAFAHPLDSSFDIPSLEGLKHTIESEEGYSHVRDAALAMVDAAMHMLEE